MSSYASLAGTHRVVLLHRDNDGYDDLSVVVADDGAIASVAVGKTPLRIEVRRNGACVMVGGRRWSLRTIRAELSRSSRVAVRA